jgi:undecaprenyl-phosphate 4-deoxy-4-formamido-L-arabinose transferase
MPDSETQYPVDVSVVIPVYNEEESLPHLRDELFPVLDALGERWEVVFVDDGSRDGTPRVLREFYEADARVRVIRFSRNFGQQMATTAGLRHVRGGVTIIMDADLEIPAENIPPILARLREGYDIVYGAREKLKGPLYRRIGTRGANFLIRKLTGIDMTDTASNFIALDESLVQNVNRFNEKSRYLSSIFAYLSYGRAASIPITRRPRQYGESKYNVLSLVRIVINLIMNWSIRPLQFASIAGGIVFAVSVALAIAAVVMLIGGSVSNGGWLLLGAAMVLVAAVQLITVGILGEYVGRIYKEVRQNPTYVIADVLERDPPEDDA